VNKKLIIGIILAIIIISAIAGMFMGKSIPPYRAFTTSKIGVIHIEGLIMGGGDSYGLFGENQGADSIIRQLREAQADNEVKAVVIRINSPGGTVPASQEIREEVVKLKKAGKKVVVSMGDVAASGGYWIATAADKIFANPGTITGSIGVIMHLQNMEELYKKIGLKPVVIKSGEHKDMGSPARELTEEERKMLKDIVMEMYEQFVKVVAEGRNMPVEKVRKIADGRIFTGSQALELGLVDELGNFYDAVDATAKMVGIEGRPQLKSYRPERSLFERLIYGITTPFGEAVMRLENILKTHQPIQLR